MTEQRDAGKDLAYYLTLFKLEGHETWRAHLGRTPEAFKKEQDRNKVSWKRAKITEQVVMRIDRLTGTFSELN